MNLKILVSFLLSLSVLASSQSVDFGAEDKDKAEKFQKVIASYPDNANAFYYLGLVQMGQEKNAEAIASFQKVLELEPGHANAAEVQQFLDYLGSL